jgi:hypothetical protein
MATRQIGQLKQSHPTKVNSSEVLFGEIMLEFLECSFQRKADSIATQVLDIGVPPDAVN